MNEWDRLRRQAERYKAEYPPGTRILLLHMGSDPRPVEDNMCGTVVAVDSIGTIHCIFDNGRQLGVIPGEDSFRALTTEELKQQQNVALLQKFHRETAKIITDAPWDDIQKAAAFFENQVFSFSSTGKSFAIAKKDMTKRLPRLLAACARLRDAIIMHRDYKDVIQYAACPGAFILLDPPYKGTEKMYQKSHFGSKEHARLFALMHAIDRKFDGECKFLITYNNDPDIRALAEQYEFHTHVQPRLHNMAQASKPGEQFEELLIANYDLEAQAEANHRPITLQDNQLSLFEFNCDY